jgi:uncharacterized protein (DUF1697 family)
VEGSFETWDLGPGTWDLELRTPVEQTGAVGNLFKRERSLMALVVFLRGVNVGGHRIFRPTALIKQLKHLDAVNIGAAGTLVVRKRVTKTRLRAELTSRLPFKTEMVICKGEEILQMIARDPFAGLPVRRDIVRFVSLLSRIPRAEPSLPMGYPADSRWLVRILERNGRFVFGIYRRDMKTIRYLGMVDRLFNVPVTTRNWNTIIQIAAVLESYIA